MSGGQMARHPFPAELLRIPRHASAVIEASAGTGKTFLLEHLVLDRIVRGDARLDEILVVTFTEKATAELVRRLRAIIARLRAAPPEAGPGGVPDDGCWIIDDDARDRLREAAHAFDRATITTIHGFCQRVLTEHSFASGRLLSQKMAVSQKVFGDAFRDALRATLAVDPGLGGYLSGWIASGAGIVWLEKLLYRAHQQKRPFGVRYDEARLRAAAAAYAALPLGALEASLFAHVKPAGTRKAVIERAQELHAVSTGLAAHGDPATVLWQIDLLVKPRVEVFAFVEERMPSPLPAALAPFWAAFQELADAAVPLALAVGQLFLPVVQERLEARKRAAGLYDYDDMLTQVAEALRGPGGPALVATLRQRYRLAVIDEFQDTDAAQWEIFKRVFQDSGGRNPLYVIGDPKQSIYGFRGADLLTYQAARADIAGAGDAAPVLLRRNFRSTAVMIDAHNAILDVRAEEPFFSDGGLYRAPVVCARADDADAVGGAPVVLLAVRPPPGEEMTRLPLRLVRRALARAIADEIEALRAGPAPADFREMFVLTRSRVEAAQVADTLRQRGIPHVLYNQEGLYETHEARHVRDLLAAIENPRDPRLRMRAWLTPFFGLRLADLPACVALPGGHPLEQRLDDWRALGDARDWARLFDRILHDSGVIERELALGGSARRLTNYQHLFDLLRGEATRTGAALGDLVRRLGALTEQVTVPAPEEGNVQRIEGDRDAVQIMTMHKAKGLEADHVFLYGAFSRQGGNGVRAFARDDQRVLYAGRPRRSATAAALDAEADGEDQRLLYVALTRARRRLYLPYAADPKVEDPSGGEAELYFRINGTYRHLHQRLRALAGARDPRMPFAVREVDCPPAPDDRAARAAAKLAAFRPAADLLALDFPAGELAERRRRHRGIVITSYTRMKQAAPEILDEAPEILDEAPEEAAPDRLPGGALSGLFLHALLEKVPLESLAGAATAEAWTARPEIRGLFDAAMRKYDRDPRHRADAERLVHAALTSALGPGVPALGEIAPGGRVAREVEFLFPFPAAAGGVARGFVKGYVDLIFEHAGRAYFGDWKSDLVGSFDADSLAAHVATHYELQRRLYALALVRMLGIADRAGYEARFGGTAYVFLRGLPDAVVAWRPTWDEVSAWEAGLAADLAGAAEEIRA